MSFDALKLETSGKGEKIDKNEALVQLEDIKDVKKYLEKLSGKDRENRLKNPEIQKQVITFLETAANNTLPKHLDKFNTKKFDTDGESGLDKFEFEQFSTAMRAAIEQIVALDGIKAFDRIHNETKEGGGWNDPTKWVAEKADLLRLAFGEGGTTQLTDSALKNIGSLSEEELHRMSEKSFSPTNTESWKELTIILAKEVGNGVEGLLKFISNIPAGIILLPRYMSYRIDSNASDIGKKTEGEIKLAELVEENSSLAIVELLGEKGIQILKDLGTMMKSGKQGDIAKILVTIAGVIAGGAGIVKFASSRARKSAIDNARKAGPEGRTTESRNTRNGLKEVSRTAGRVAEVAGKVDDIINTVGAGHAVNAIVGGISNNKAEITKKRTKVEKSTDLPTAIKLNEDIANEAKIRGVDEKVIRKERLINNEGLSGEQADRVIAAHTIRRKGESLGKYGITSLKEKIKTMIEGDGGLTIDQARNMLKKGYAGVFEDSQNLLNEINRKGGTDFLESKLAGKNINQVELNALVSEFIIREGGDIAKIDDTIQTIFEISGYAGDKAKMYTEATKFAKDLKINELIKNIKNIVANEIFKHISTEGLEASENLVRAFLKDGSKDALNTFLKTLEGNNSIRNSLLNSNLKGEFIKKLGENYTTQHKIITDIIGDEKLLKSLSSETLKELDSILNKMIGGSIVSGGFADTLKTKLALIQNANSPANKIAYFLQNSDEKIAELLRVTSPEKTAWNMLFENLRSTDNGTVQRLNMIKRGEPSFFNTNDLGDFFNMNFWDLEKGTQKEFIKTYITPTNGKYHTVLEQFPRFKEKLENNGFI